MFKSGESRTCVDAVDDEVSDSNSYEVISRADLKMNGGSITTNGINSYGAYANGKKAYINLDYVALETVADGSYAVAIRQGNIDIKIVLLQQQALKPHCKNIQWWRVIFFPMSPRYQNKIKEYQLMHQISILKPK